MGRKIKGKKHKGIKDPREQALRRFESIANQMNDPPSCTDDQPMPEKVLKIMEYKNKPVQMKKQKKKKSRKKLLSTKDFILKEVEQPGMTRPVKTPEIVTQKRGESFGSFYKRVNESCMQRYRETVFEDKFNVRVQRDPQTGVVTGVEPAKKTESDAIIDEAKTNKAQKKKKTKMLSKWEKRKLKLIAKAEMRSENKTTRDFSDFKDEVKFGEVVHRPPELTVLPKKRLIANSQVQKPGERDLLLKALFNTEIKKPEADVQKKKNTAQESATRKRMLEEERIRVVELYRSIKSRKGV